MSVDELVRFFRELGFPAGVAIFVLWRVEARLLEITKALLTLQATITALLSQRS